MSRLAMVGRGCRPLLAGRAAANKRRCLSRTTTGASTATGTATGRPAPSACRPRICVVGSGPAGFYTAYFVRKALPSVAVDVVERLPVPFGLVRFGVAPDHPEVKNVIAQFDSLASSPDCRFFGNVEVGRDVALSELQERYSAIVLAYGTDDNRRLGVPGEGLGGVHSAKDFVGWYNGHPDHAALQPDLGSTDTAVVLGHGNVALDVARLLLKPVAELAKTDITANATAQLAQSSVRRVFVVGRRGPLEVAFTIKELRELTRIPGCQPILAHDHATLSEEESAFAAQTRPRKRLMELLGKTSAAGFTGTAEREWHLLCRRSPVEFVADPDRPGHVGKVVLRENELVGPPGARRVAPTDNITEIPCGLVVVSIGYKGLSVDGDVPFDSASGTVRHDGGRVEGLVGVYCSGWIKNGPNGVIATTMHDAQHTAAAIVEDWKANNLPDPPADESAPLEALLQERGVEYVTFEGWQAIHQHELAQGQATGKPFEKVTSTQDMLRLARTAAQSQ